MSNDLILDKKLEAKMRKLSDRHYINVAEDPLNNKHIDTSMDWPWIGVRAMTSYGEGFIAACEYLLLNGIDVKVYKDNDGKYCAFPASALSTSTHIGTLINVRRTYE